MNDITILKNKTTYHGVCLVDVFKAPGDLFEFWDIVPKQPDGSFLRLPCAPNRNGDLSRSHLEPVEVVEHYVLFERNGWKESETTIRLDGLIVGGHRG